MAEDLFATVALTTWADFKKFTDDLSQNWAFRGQLSADWELRNAIERTDFIRLYNGIEADFVSEFQRGARNYLHRDEIPEHLIEWLALMQHHGAPTRLLDFTWSPFIASFFAFEACHVSADTHITIWAINIKFLKQKATEVLAQHFSKDLEESANLVNEKLFEKIFHANRFSLVNIAFEVGGQDHQAVEFLDALQQEGNFLVRVFVVRALYRGALAEQGIGFVEEQKPVAVLCPVKNLVQVLFRFANVFGNNLRQVDAVHVFPEFLPDQGCGKRFAGTGRTVK